MPTEVTPPPPPSEETVLPPAEAADPVVADVISDLAQLQPPSPTRAAKTKPAKSQPSPTPHDRHSKTMKHNECSSAGAGNIINKSVTDMDIDTDDAVEEKEHVHGIDAAGVVDMNVSGKEPPATKTIAHDVETTAAAVGNLGESLTSVFRGQPQLENIKPGGKFNCPEMLFKSVETQFRSSGMNAASLARKTKSTTYTENDKTPWGNARSMVFRREEIKIPKRGKFYCTHPSDNGNGSCTYNVAFSFVQGALTILDGQGPDKTDYNTNFCLEHSHSLENICIGVDNCFVVSKLEDLELEEIEFINTLAQVHCSIPQVMDGLRHRFVKDNNRAYSSVLVRNRLNAARDEIFGKDRHRMKELTEHGLQTIKSGGVWETDLSDMFVLIGVRYQSPIMRQYAEQYGAYFFTCDGTYGTNMYGLTTMPMVTVDCIGFSHCCGASIGLSENSADVIKACQSFSLSSVLNESEEVNVSIVSFFIRLVHNITAYTYLLPLSTE